MKINTKGSAILQFYNGTIPISGLSNFFYPFFHDSTSGGPEYVIIAPYAGKLKNLFVHHLTPGGNGNSISYTIRKNSVDTTLVTTMASTASIGSNTSDIINVAQGDRLSFRANAPVSIGASPSGITANFEIEKI